MFTAVSSGTGSFVVSAAVTGFDTPTNAGAIDTNTYPYFAQSADLTQWEVGLGVWSAGSVTLTRATILLSSNANAVVTFSAAPNVAIDARAEDFIGEKLAGHAGLGGL